MFALERYFYPHLEREAMRRIGFSQGADYVLKRGKFTDWERDQMQLDVTDKLDWEKME